MINDIILKVDNNSTYIEGKLESNLYKSFKKELGYLPENSFWMINKNSKNDKMKWKQEWDGYVSNVCWNKKYCKCSIKKEGIHFSTGLLSNACDFFENNNVEYKIIDIRKKTEKTNKYYMSDEFEKRDYQQEIIDKITKGKGIDRGIIKAATGSGKTSLCCGIIAGIGVSPTIVYVPTVDLLKQTKNEIERFIKCTNGDELKVGVVGGGEKDIQDITVMTIQTAVKALGGVWVKYDDEDVNEDNTDITDIKDRIKDLIQNCRLMISDEIQFWAAETCQIISDHSVFCQYKFGVSATVHRDLGDDILIDGCFGKIIADINASYLIKKGYLVKPHIYFCDISNMRGIGKQPYLTVYKKAIVENDFRNKKIAEFAKYFKDNGRKILILVKQIEHGKILEEMIPDSVFLYGGTSKKKREEYLDIMRKGIPGVILASTIFDQGINCCPLDTLINAGSGKSIVRALQRIGRILRPHPGKKDAIVIDFMDHCRYLESHSKKREKIYKTEEEFIIERPK